MGVRCPWRKRGVDGAFSGLLFQSSCCCLSWFSSLGLPYRSRTVAATLQVMGGGWLKGWGDFCTKLSPARPGGFALTGFCILRPGAVTAMALLSPSSQKRDQPPTLKVVADLAMQVLLMGFVRQEAFGRQLLHL